MVSLKDAIHAALVAAWVAMKKRRLENRLKPTPLRGSKECGPTAGMLGEETVGPAAIGADGLRHKGE